MVAADATSIELGAVLTQGQQIDHWLPIAYALRYLTPTESKYTYIEKHLLKQLSSRG